MSQSWPLSHEADNPLVSAVLAVRSNNFTLRMALSGDIGHGINPASYLAPFTSYCRLLVASRWTDGQSDINSNSSPTSCVQPATHDDNFMHMHPGKVEIPKFACGQVRSPA